MLDIAREGNIEVLRQACHAYDASVRELAKKVHQLSIELARLQGLDVSQVKLDLPEIVVTSAPLAEPAPETTTLPPSGSSEPAFRSQRGHGPRRQSRLPIEDLFYVFDPAPECAVCGGDMEAMAGQYESSEEVTVVEVHYKLLTHHRQKYRCRCNANVLTVPGPEKLIPGGRYSVEFAAHSATAKFADHIPLERQVRMMARQGLEITSQTLWDQQAALASWLEPTWQEIWRLLLAEDVLHVDETGWKMMAGRGETGSQSWTLFGLTTAELSAYHLMSSKSTVAARKILSGFSGTLVVDGYAVYPLVAALEEGPIRIAHCWAHADRKLEDAKDPPAAIAEVRGLIAKLYEVERKVEGPFPGDELAQRERLLLRVEESAAIIAQIRDFAFAQGGLHRSTFGKALRYVLKHWAGLTVFLDDPKVPLSNNAAERALRGPVVGRKNFFGNRSKRGAKVAAILYTLVETAKLQGVDPAAYLANAAKAAIRRPGTVTLPG